MKAYDRSLIGHDSEDIRTLDLLDTYPLIPTQNYELGRLS